MAIPEPHRVQWGQDNVGASLLRQFRGRPEPDNE